MADIEKIDLESEDLVADRIERLKQLFPEIVTERAGGGTISEAIDFAKLRLLLGDEVDEGQERYAFTWPGKADAIRQSQTVSTATLRPCPEKSRGRDGEDGSFDSDNIYIEGDNLEVLKLLQRGYHGKVKMIYIDPPYNTGDDYVYEDSFDETVANYKKQIGSALQSNPDTNGRFHTAWCSLMYPRLKLARELLASDGVIYISIGNQELANLLAIADEIFGYANRLGIIAWESKTKCQNTATAKRQLQPKQEYILVYSRRPGRYEFSLEVTGENVYDKTDESGRPYRLKKIEEMSASGIRGRETMVFPILGVMPEDGKQWKLGKDSIQYFEDRGDLLLVSGRPHFRCRPDDEEASMAPFWSLIGKEIGTAESAKTALKKMMGDCGFETVKPTALIEKLLMHVCGNDDKGIVVDFFAGSSTTADAVMRYNAAKGKQIQCVSIQLPELCKEGSQSRNAGYHNICELGEKRICCAGDAIKAEIEKNNALPRLGEEPKTLPDIGFRVFALDESGIERPEPGQLVLDVVKPDRAELDIVFEMMLKWGLELTLPVEKSEAAGYPVWSVACDELVCCMSRGLTIEALEAIAGMEPRRVLILDSVLDDTLKLNAVQIFKHAGERMGCEIELRTV